jgi:N-acetyl-anhydromuramyl-L-alanine amidase AmpD
MQPQDSEHALREREIAVKEGELELKRREASGAAWRSPLVLSVIGAALAAAGNAAVSFFNGRQQIDLEDRKSEQSRILEMVKTGSPDKAAENLRFLVDAGLVSDPLLRQRLEKFQRERQPGTGPSLPTPTGNSIAERLALLDKAAASSLAPAAAEGARFHVSNHVLFGPDGRPVSVMEAISKGRGHLVAARAIVLHYTADASPDAAARSMSASDITRAVAPGSTHLLIRRDGKVTQLVAFDVPAVHVGPSHWNGLDGLNGYTLGLMFENRGRLARVDGKWPIDEQQIFFARTAQGEIEAWERYTPEQIATASEVVYALGRAYPTLEAVLRHSEVALPPGRRIDPGPALDMAPFVDALRDARAAAVAAPAGSAP